jgi:hypothetical protein
MRELVLIQPGRMLEGLTAREAGEAHANERANFDDCSHDECVVVMRLT